MPKGTWSLRDESLEISRQALDLIRGKRGEDVGPRIAIRPEWSAGRRECPRKLLYPMS